MTDFTYIRDEILINSALKARIEKQNLPLGSKIWLVARQIRHESGFPLNLSGYDVVIVTREYDSNGGNIDISGREGIVGSTGASGTFGSNSNEGGEPGGIGGSGGSGGIGYASTTLRFTCEHLRNAHFIANGGMGGQGGEGGEGGHGGDGRIVFKPIDPIIIEGTMGGDGGNGGTGGAGGTGGQIFIASITTDTIPVLESAGGSAGSSGAGGAGGRNGKQSIVGKGNTGASGSPGLLGASGQINNSQVSNDEYWNLVLAELGASTAEWTEHRLAVGEYYYRAYNPEIFARKDFLVLAMQEFEAVLRLSPANDRAVRLQRQILLNQNILGLSNDLDLIPQFEKYINDFQVFGILLFGVFNQGINLMLTSNDIANIRGQLDIQKDSIQSSITDTKEVLQEAQKAQKDAEKEVQEAQLRLEETKRQIKVALDEMNNQSFSIGEIIGVVGSIATFVTGIVTGGASLVTLLPDAVHLAEQVDDNANPLIKQLFKEKAALRDEVVDKYKKIGKDYDKVVDGGKSLVNLVDVIAQLAAGKTPDNRKYVELVQQGTDLIHAQLLAEDRQKQAIHKVEVVKAKLARTEALLLKTQNLLTNLSQDELTIREAGLSAIRSAQLYIDSLLGSAFYAQRSVEIYALKSEIQNLFFDAGYVHPDTDRDFVELYFNGIDLISAYSQSWNRLLQPRKMQDDYAAFFSGHNNLDADSLRLSFTDFNLLQKFKDTHKFQLTIDWRDLPNNHFDAKVQGVFVAFVGAKSQSGIISCEIRHGERYEQKRPDGSVAVQLLQSRVNTHQAKTNRLELAGVIFAPTLPLTAPQSLSFWGRGVAGLWDLSISEFELNTTDLTGLSEIQIWVGYQFFR
jgi:hypothetical protein